MGQQQLLLLVLGIVIVGLAVVVGIQAFEDNQRQANADALTTDAVRIASDVQAQALKPQQFGGYGGWKGTTGTAWPSSDADVMKDIGYSSTTMTNANGSFTIESGSGSCSSAPTIPSGGTPDIAVVATSSETGNKVCVGVAGTDPEDIGTRVDYGS